MGIKDLQAMQVDILVASPRPDEVDLEQVKATAPIGQKIARSVAGGMVVTGLCVPDFAPNCNQIVVVNAAVTVSIQTE